MLQTVAERNVCPFLSSGAISGCPGNPAKAAPSRWHPPHPSRDKGRAGRAGEPRSAGQGAQDLGWDPSRGSEQHKPRARTRQAGSSRVSYPGADLELLKSFTIPELLLKSIPALNWAPAPSKHNVAAVLSPEIFHVFLYFLCFLDFLPRGSSITRSSQGFLIPVLWNPRSQRWLVPVDVTPR